MPFNRVHEPRKLRVRGMTVGLLAIAVALIAAVSASADPIKDKRAQAETIMAEIQTIDEEVGAAAERWNGANLELQSLTVQLADTRKDLVRARRLLGASRRRVATRLRDLYVNGAPDSTLEVLLGASSLDDVITRLDATQRIAQQDARIVREATTFRKNVEKREGQLADARARQAVVVQNLAGEKQAIEARLVERQRLLASVKDEIVRLEAEERRRQAELRRQAQLELQRQQRVAAAQAAAAAAALERASTEGADVSAGTPLGDYTPPPADAALGAQVVAIAMQYLGIPYVWGGASPSQGFDCSGLTMYVYAQVGISLPHYAAAQYGYGVPVGRDQLEPGDLVFFRGLGHMGMFIGGGNFIHAPHTGDVVKISSISEPSYVATWVGARRVL